MTTLNFLEECKKLGKTGKVAMLEAGKEGERCGASRWYINSARHLKSITDHINAGLWPIYDSTKTTTLTKTGARRWHLFLRAWLVRGVPNTRLTSFMPANGFTFWAVQSPTSESPRKYVLTNDESTDQNYCDKMVREAPITAQYLVDHGVKLNHHKEE